MNDRETTARVMELIPYGLYVVGSLNGTVPATIVANWVTQVSFSPPWVAIAVEADSRMREYIGRSGLFSVNILPSGGRDLAKAFLKGSNRERTGRPFFSMPAPRSNAGSCTRSMSPITWCSSARFSMQHCGAGEPMS